MEQLDTLSSQISFATDGSQYLTNGLAKAGEKLVVLLDIDTVLGGAELTAIGSAN